MIVVSTSYYAGELLELVALIGGMLNTVDPILHRLAHVGIYTRSSLNTNSGMRRKHIIYTDCGRSRFAKAPEMSPQTSSRKC